MKPLSPEQRAAIAELRRRLEAAGCPIVRMALFGSYARGQVHEESDIDLLVLVRGESRPWVVPAIDAAAAVEVETGVPLSVKVISEEDFERRARDPLDFAHAISKEAVPVG